MGITDPLGIFDQTNLGDSIPYYRGCWRRPVSRFCRNEEATWNCGLWRAKFETSGRADLRSVRRSANQPSESLIPPWFRYGCCWVRERAEDPRTQLCYRFLHCRVHDLPWIGVL